MREKRSPLRLSDTLKTHHGNWIAPTFYNFLCCILIYILQQQLFYNSKNCLHHGWSTTKDPFHLPYKKGGYIYSWFYDKQGIRKGSSFQHQILLSYPLSQINKAALFFAPLRWGKAQHIDLMVSPTIFEPSKMAQKLFRRSNFS